MSKSRGRGGNGPQLTREWQPSDSERVYCHSGEALLLLLLLLPLSEADAVVVAEEEDGGADASQRSMLLAHTITPSAWRQISSAPPPAHA